MRKVVDTSEDPGRIILISGLFLNLLPECLSQFHFIFQGDSDFSTDLHSFRYVKMYETILIYSDKTTVALIKVATKAIPFKQMNQSLVVSEDVIVPRSRSKKSKPKYKHPTNHSGCMKVAPDPSAWF